jgi:hypothetical protein
MKFKSVLFLILVIVTILAVFGFRFASGQTVSSPLAFSFGWSSSGKAALTNPTSVTCGDTQPDELDIHYSSSPAGINPAIPLDQAIEMAKKYSDFSALAQPNVVKGQYVFFSDNVRGRASVPGDDDTVTLDFQNVPAWVVTFCGLSIPANGSYEITKAGHILPNHTEWNVVLNAQTGEYIEEYTFR